MLAEKGMCQAPDCVEIFMQKPGGRRRDFCSDACRKRSARLGRRETPVEKLNVVSAQMKDVRALMTQVHREFCELDEKFYLLLDWWGSAIPVEVEEQEAIDL